MVEPEGMQLFESNISLFFGCQCLQSFNTFLNWSTAPLGLFFLSCDMPHCWRLLGESFHRICEEYHINKEPAVQRGSLHWRSPWKSTSKLSDPWMSSIIWDPPNLVSGAYHIIWAESPPYLIYQSDFPTSQFYPLEHCVDFNIQYCVHAFTSFLHISLFLVSSFLLYSQSYELIN